MAAGAAMRVMVPFTPTFRVDKPFVFLIRHKKTGSILFLGRMMNLDESGHRGDPRHGIGTRTRVPNVANGSEYNHRISPDQRH